MFDYIKSKIAENNNDIFGSNIEAPNSNEDNVIVEYAHIFQELDELSVEGEDSLRDRSLAIDIPIEDDLEIESIEFNIGDGRITDIPMDATVQEAQYDKMKSFDEFIQEAYQVTKQYQRESDDSYDNRIIGIANKKYNEYQNMCIQEGMFGFGMININDDRVPASTYCDFGNIVGTEKNYCVKLDIFFVIDTKGRISKKQLDAINAFRSCEPTKNIAPVLLKLLKNKYPDKMKDIENIWDVATPSGIYVMEQTTKDFEVSIMFKISFLEKDEEDFIMCWTKSPNSKTKQSKSDDLTVKKLNESIIRSCKSKNNVIRESYEIKHNKRPSRFDDIIIQEAIDFGNDAPETDNNPPGVDNGEEPSVGGDETPTDTGEPTIDNTTTTTDADAVPVDTNDVSDQIADKVADDQTDTGIDNDLDMGDTSEDGGVDSTDLNLDDTTTDTTTGDDTNVDKKLDELDSMNDDTDDDLENNENVEIDVNNMTIDELIQQGSDKLKGMTIQQIKDFISQNSDEQIQEAFIITKNNVNKELLSALKYSLLILNDSEKDAKTLLNEFKKTGKYLNKVLSKAGKSSKVYSDEEIEHIKKLNKILVDLITTMKDRVTDDSYVQTIKTLIKLFISQSVVVNKFCEEKANGNKPTEIVSQKKHK